MAAKQATSIQDLWHYAVGSERKGPVPQATLASLLAAGEISAETYVWQPGMENWVHLGDAAPLTSLVAGVGGDQPVEVFVEEDTAFNTADELLAAHSALAASDADDEAPIPTAVITEIVEDDGDAVTGDTVVESVDDVFGAITVDYDEPEENTLIGTGGGVFIDIAAAVAEDDHDDDVLASAGEPAAAASGVDIFGDADADDIFAEASPEPLPMVGVGAHSRHSNSVLFSLDDLGREDGEVIAPTGGDPFVTDSSGLIDIKAIADSQEERHEWADPFASASPMSSRAGGVGMVSIPIVERRSSLGPWILAAALVLLLGGGVLAFIIMSGDDGPHTDNPPVTVAQVTNPTGAAVETPPAAAKADEVAAAKAAEAAKAEEAKAAAVADDAAVAAAGVEAAGGSEAAAGGDPAVAGAEPASDEAMKAAIAKAEAEAQAKAEEEAKARAAADSKTRRPATSRTAHTVAAASRDRDPAPAARIEVAEAPRTAPSAGNTRKVNALLEKLNNPNEGTTTSDAPDTNMPKKLSAASLRQTLRQNRARFAKCGASLGADASSVKVTTSFVIQGATGEVQSARIISGGGTSPEVQRCVVGELKNTVFGRFSDATMTVNFPIQLM